MHHRFGVLALLRALSGSGAANADVVDQSTSQLLDGSPSLGGGGRVPIHGAPGFRQKPLAGLFIELVDDGDPEPAAGRKRSDFGYVRRLDRGIEFVPSVPEC